ncbi:MAG TPA: amino acid ABC transporter permease, partial [Eubacteriaceae bacterium]|nr:amino acid ABC transporter permease [Eubacteriaceae bacterium]
MNLMEVFSESGSMLWAGLQITIQVTVYSLLLALVLGLILSLMGLSKTPLKWISKLYVGIIRGTPMMVQVFYFYFALPQLLQYLGYDLRFTPFTAGVV